MCFVSHYKCEAGSDARYLKDLLERMGNAPVYLDSNNLVNLTTLFDQGIDASDVVLLLCTKSVLMRPWCLLEVYEAHVRGIAVVLAVVERAGFPSRDENRRFILNLESELHGRNPGAFDTIKDYTDKSNTITLSADVAAADKSLRA